MEIVIVILIHVLNLSLCAGFVAAAVLVLRLLLARAPKLYSYLLWMIVFIRFLCPFTMQSVLSLVPVKQRTIAFTGNALGQISVDTGINRVDYAADSVFHSGILSQIAPSGETTAQITMSVLSVIWLTGIAALLLYTVICSVRLNRKLYTATLVLKKSGRTCAVYETDQIKSPFLQGIINPRIYIPVGMAAQDLTYVLAHEQMHVKRKDYLVKPFCFLAVIIHWFNPLAWISFFMMVKDMELSCDEAVVRRTKEDIRTQYSSALLNVSMKQSGLLLPLSFGESNTKVRIKNILNLKRPVTWIGIAGIIILIAASVTLLTSSDRKEDTGVKAGSVSGIEVNVTKPVGNSKLKESETATATQTALIKNRTPYIGNNSKDLALISVLPGIDGLEYDHIELQTKNEPYELTIFFQGKGESSLTRKANDTAIADAALLFSTIENMGICRFNIMADGNNQSLVYNRSDMEKCFGKLYPQSADVNHMKKLEKKITDYLISYDLDQSVSKAILDTNKNGYLQGEFRTESHDTLYIKNRGKTVTVYAMVMYLEYGYDNGKFTDISGCHMPVAITFSINATGDYVLKEYWMPQDGSYYSDSIKKKFPKSIEEDALDTQKYDDREKAECDKKAGEYLSEKEANKETAK